MHVKIEWNQSCSVKNSRIDNQHKIIFELVDDIPDTLDAAKIKKSIMKLFRYTRIHFKQEENLMREMGYPELAAHQKLHDYLLSRLSEFSDIEFTDQNSLAEFKEFAYDWLVSHIMEQDMEYYFFAKDNNLIW